MGTASVMIESLCECLLKKSNNVLLVVPIRDCSFSSLILVTWQSASFVKKVVKDSIRILWDTYSQSGLKI